MEGPSLKLAEAQLKPFKGKKVLAASGNTKLGTEQYAGLEVKDIFSWGKHLVFQFPDFAVRIHFMLFGTYEADVDGISVTGDYKRARVPRLAFVFDNGQISMFNCSVKLIESKSAKREYDFSIDILSPKWDKAKIKKLLAAQKEEELADALLDQEIFAGVGNIIKNEVLSLVKQNPRTKVGMLKSRELDALIDETRAFSKQFLAWRKKFVLRKNLKVHGRGTCPYCGSKLTKQKTGKRERWAYWCPIDQPKRERSGR
ncbi:MAG: endonuclease [Parcubacteria group bacterium]|nr:endonuclease [Parcubacteria group bacterium]